MKPRLLVVNQYYWPGVEATAHLLTELCEALAGEYEIRVLTGVLRGHERKCRGTLAFRATVRRAKRATRRRKRAKGFRRDRRDRPLASFARA